MKVNFFIVGAPKAGTTSLYSYLNQHHSISMSLVKEPNYFSHKEILAQKLYYKTKLITDLKNITHYLISKIVVVYMERLVFLIYFIMMLPLKLKNITKMLKLLFF